MHLNLTKTKITLKGQVFGTVRLLESFILTGCWLTPLFTFRVVPQNVFLKRVVVISLFLRGFIPGQSEKSLKKMQTSILKSGRPLETKIVPNTRLPAILKDEYGHPKRHNVTRGGHC